MRSEAKISLFGHVGQDPRKPSEKNPDFITFSFAVTQNWKNESGEKQEHTDWYEVITSQKGLSGLVNDYVKKGDPLYVEGTPKYGIYTTKEGEIRHKVTVTLSKIVLLGRKNDEEETQSNQAQGQGQSPSRAGSGSIKDSLDDEIPF